MIVLLGVTMIGCRDRQSPNDELTVIFYTGLNSTYAVSTRIDPLLAVEYGSTISRPEDPISEGATFLGWYKDQACTIPWDFENDHIIASTVIYSKWDYKQFNVNYIFDDAGGNFIDEVFTTFSVNSIRIFPRADRLGSLFLGWILTPVDQYKVGDTIVKTTDGFSGDVTLYALFENNEFTVRFRSLLDTVANPSTHVVVFASDIDFPILADTATKTFAGWYSMDGRTTGEWGFQYVNGETFRGKAVSYNTETGEWEFNAQGITVYAKWIDK